MVVEAMGRLIARIQRLLQCDSKAANTHINHNGDAKAENATTTSEMRHEWWSFMPLLPGVRAHGSSTPDGKGGPLGDKHGS